MKTYTVHFPKGTADITGDALAEAVLIRDDCSWGAFFFGPFWMFWNRLWLAGLLVLSVMAACSVLFRILGIGEFLTSLADLLIMTLIGLEANSLKRRTFERRGRPVAGIVTGHDETEAEAKMIALGLNGGPQARRGSSPVLPIMPFTPAAGAAPEALGLFPSLERPR